MIGGLAGFAAGGRWRTRSAARFLTSQIAIQPVLLPVILVMAVMVTFAGSAAAIRRAVQLDPVFALRGEL